MPPAARITDMHTCPMVNPGPVPHVGGPIIKGQPTVLTMNLPQARISDQCICIGPPDIIVKGSMTVLCGGLPSARMGDSTAHGGVIVMGAPTVLIGNGSNGGGGGGGGGAGMPGNVPFSAPNLQSKTMIAAHKEAKPFCAICEAGGGSKAAAVRKVAGDGTNVGASQVNSRTTRLKSPINKDLDDMYAKAPLAKEEIDKIADELKERYGGHVAKAPLKGRARAEEKVRDDYDGDASKLKDIARNTIIVDKGNIKSVVADLKSKGAKVKEFTPDNNALGYSGVNSTLITTNGLVAEIQVNTAEMIYAKEPPKLARELIGSETYDNIAKNSAVEGGKGHEIYERHRQLSKDDPARKALEKESKAYYALFGGR